MFEHKKMWRIKDGKDDSLEKENVVFGDQKTNLVSQDSLSPSNNKTKDFDNAKFGSEKEPNDQ